MTKTTTATKTVIILARYAVKASGSIVCKVRGGNKEYLVTLNANGSHTCLQASGEPCPSSKGRKPCYHITQCAAIEQDRQVTKILSRPMPEKVRAYTSEIGISTTKRVPTDSERATAPLNGNRPFSLFR